MEKHYRNISFLFVGLLIIIVAGFYKSYFGQFPKFTGLPTMAHLHALAFVSWFALLIIQPILISKKQFATHRLLGKVSYFLVPFIVFTTLGMEKFSHSKYVDLPRDVYLAAYFTTFYGVTIFLTFYCLAMYYRKKVAYHLRYIVASSLILIAPGLHRLTINVGIPVPYVDNIPTIFPYLILIGLIFYDKSKKKTIKPYLVALAIFLVFDIFSFYFTKSDVWQWFAGHVLDSFLK